MTRREALQPLAELHRANGMGYRAISETLGVSLSTIFRWLKPDYAERQRAVSRAYKDAHRVEVRAKNRAYSRVSVKRCDNPACGADCGSGSAAKRGLRTYCASCRQAVADVRRTLGEGMWADGWTCREVADALGVESIAYINAMRARGWDVPHRRTPEQVARITAGVRRGMGMAA